MHCIWNLFTCQVALGFFEPVEEPIPTPNRWPAGAKFLCASACRRECQRRPNEMRLILTFPGEWCPEREEDEPEGFLLEAVMTWGSL